MTAEIATMRNPYLEYSEAVARRRLDGEPLTFAKGDWPVGKGDTALAASTRLVAIMPTLMIGWVKWRSGKPVDGRMGLVVDGFKPPRRADLDDHESANWEEDAAGDLRDPWQSSNEMVFITPDAKRIFTFRTSSRGGFSAIGELCKAHARAPGKTYPLVTLETGSYQHHDRSIGKVKFPVFGLVKHLAAGPFDEALAAARGEGASPPALDEAAPPLLDDDVNLRREIDDDIPF